MAEKNFDARDIPDDLLKKFPFATPELVAACLLREVRSVYRQKFGHSLLRATITIPASWNPEQRRATKMAALIAGFQDVRLLEEPVAALLWQIDLDAFKEKSEYILVVDFGGGTCDLAIVHIEKGKVRLIGATSNDRLGGEIVDELLYRDFLNNFENYVNSIITSNREQGDPLVNNSYLDCLNDIKHKSHHRARIRRQLEEFKIGINKHLLSQRNHEQSTLADISAEDLYIFEDEGSDYTTYSDPILVGGRIGHFTYSLSYEKFINLLSTPCQLLINNNLMNDDSAPSVIGAFETLLSETRELYLKGIKTINVYLAGGSSHLYFVREIIDATLSSFEEEVEENLRKDVDKQIIALPEREKAVVKGAALFEKLRLQGAKAFVSKFFYALSLKGTSKNKVILEEGVEISPDGYRFGPKNYLPNISSAILPRTPLKIELSQSGKAVGHDEIIKELYHEQAIDPGEEIQFRFNISPDSIISIDARLYKNDTRFKCIENYPVTPKEGLQGEKEKFHKHMGSDIY